MATTEKAYTAGISPAINDIIAGLVIIGAYVTRFGVVTEGVTSWYHLPLLLTTDFLLPVLAGVWFIAVPMYRVVQKYRE